MLENQGFIFGKHEMISEYILGMNCCLKSGSEPLVSLNNSCLQNKFLVMFEWSKVGSKLKDWISSHIKG